MGEDTKFPPRETQHRRKWTKAVVKEHHVTHREPGFWRSTARSQESKGLAAYDRELKRSMVSSGPSKGFK